jgi:hypothetical protein
MGLLDQNSDEQTGLFKMIEYSQAKSSLMMDQDAGPAGLSSSLYEDKLEDKKQKIVIA